MLRKKIEEFFEEHPIDVDAEELPTPTQLAIFLGYPSQQSLYSEINSPTEPEYSMYLAQAVDMIKDSLIRRQMRIAEIGKRWEGIDAALERMQRIEERTMPDTDSKGSIAIQINMNAREKTKQLVDESIASLLGDLAASNLRDVTPAETAAVKEEA